LLIKQSRGHIAFAVGLDLMPETNASDPETREAAVTREEGNLAQADRHIAATELRIARQAELIAGLPAAGGNRALAEELLAAVEQSLVLMHEHRRLILAAIARERSGLP
jgi:hypothetical protein